MPGWIDAFEDALAREGKALIAVGERVVTKGSTGILRGLSKIPIRGGGVLAVVTGAPALYELGKWVLSPWSQSSPAAPIKPGYDAQAIRMGGDFVPPGLEVSVAPPLMSAELPLPTVPEIAEPTLLDQLGAFAQSPVGGVLAQLGAQLVASRLSRGDVGPVELGGVAVGGYDYGALPDYSGYGVVSPSAADFSSPLTSPSSSRSCNCAKPKKKKCKPGPYQKKVVTSSRRSGRYTTQKFYRKTAYRTC